MNSQDWSWTFGDACCLLCIRLPGYIVIWSFFCSCGGGKGALVRFNPLAPTVLGFVLRFYVMHWLLYSFVDFSRACRFEFVTTVYWSCDEYVCN